MENNTATFHFYRDASGLYNLASSCMNVAVSNYDEAKALFPNCNIILHD